MNYLVRITVFLAAILLSSGIITSVNAQEDSFLTTLEMDGFADVIENNRAEAKENAVNDAIRRAVEKTVESMLSPQVLLNNYTWVSSIYSNSEDYIHSYSFLSESFDEEYNIYSVTLKITLYPAYIKSLLASQDTLNDNIDTREKVLIIIRERGLFSSNEKDFWEYIPISEMFFVQKFESEGLGVVDRDTLMDKVDIALIQKSMKGDVQAAIRAGLLSSAQIVITGNAVARERGSNPENPNIRNYQANISLKAYQTKTGKILGARSEFVTISNDNKEVGELNAFMAAGKKIYNSFISNIIPKD
tara:strand:+ start:1587 stop:2495 length:909 start_codon:yes stop_codon:yes gene_type:complete